VGALSRGESNVKTRRGSKVDSERGSVAGSVAGDQDSDAEVMEVENSVHTPKRGGDEGTGGGIDGREQVEGGSEEQDNSKRKERSPTLDEESARTRRRLNEFDLGEVFHRIEEGVKKKAEEVIARTPEGFRESLKEGMGTLIQAVVEMMNGMSDGIKEQRLGRETLELRVEDRIGRLEEKVKDVVVTTDALTELRIKSREKDSIKQMESKVEEAMCCVKVLTIDIGKETEDKREIVRKSLDTVRSYLADRDRNWFETVLRRTRVVILGKGTRKWDRGGSNEYTVPTLFQCRDRMDAESLEGMLRGAGYHPTFHWPSEMLDFIWKVKDEIRKTGVDDRCNFFKVRPEKRDGAVQIKVEVKAKEGGTRFFVKGVWSCPPFHRFLWDSVPGLLKSKIPIRE